jgi:hypothetical protein
VFIPHLSRPIHLELVTTDVIISERGDRDSACETSNSAKLRQCKMSYTAYSERTTSGGDNADTAIASIRIPPFWPDDVELCFTMLEAQFKEANITCDRSKYRAAFANLDKKHARLIRDVLDAPPETGCYEFFKKELIKRLGDSDAKRLRRALEKEQMGDRTLSQFYRDLRNLATNSISGRCHPHHLGRPTPVACAERPSLRTVQRP